MRKGGGEGRGEDRGGQQEADGTGRLEEGTGRRGREQRKVGRDEGRREAGVLLSHPKS